MGTDESVGCASATVRSVPVAAVDAKRWKGLVCATQAVIAWAQPARRLPARCCRWWATGDLAAPYSFGVPL